MSIFGSSPVYVDPWEIEYGEQLPASIEQDNSIDATVEKDLDQWGPIKPPSTTIDFDRIVLIDGTRRIDARIHQLNNDSVVYGAFASYAVGAVTLSSTEARIEKYRLRHSAILTDSQSFPQPIVLRPGLTYQPESTPETGSDAVIQHLQHSMRRAEGSIAAEMSDAQSLVIADGPLRFESFPENPALGYIKSIHNLYVENEQQRTIRSLTRGTRTPIFLIETSQQHLSMFSWFVRLSDMGVASSPMHGLVRIECYTHIGFEKAQELADFSCKWLPGVASKRGHDARWPQNLVPIGALESQLRKKLADRNLVKRWIEELVQQQVQT